MNWEKTAPPRQKTLARKMESFERTYEADRVLLARKMESFEHTYDDDRVLFWVERISLSVLTLYWVLHTTFSLWLPREYMILWVGLSTLTCLLYLSNFGLRDEYYYLIRHQNKASTKQPPDHKLNLRVTDVKEPIGREGGFCYGFWLERLAMLYLGYGIVLYTLRNHQANLIFNLCFVILFPLLNVYYACFGYSLEFQQRLHQEGGIEKEEVEGKNIDLSDSKEQLPLEQRKLSIDDNGSQDMDKDGDLSAKEGEKDTEGAKGVEDERSSQPKLVSEAAKNFWDEAPSSSAKDFGMWENLGEDRFVDVMKLLDSILDEYQRKWEESEYARERNFENLFEDAWNRKYKKVVEKYEEDYQKLKEQKEDLALKLSAANASCELYRSLLHDNVFSV